MRFDKLYLDNPFLKIPAQAIDFSSTGIYLITGKNGIGKSSLLNAIAFGESACVCPTQEQTNAYVSNRGALISYVPQVISVPDTTVLYYIKKDNPNISETDIIDYLKKFDMSDIRLSSRIKPLSGGEQLKLCIIAALLKATPYLFLDEPTNHLDDRSSAILMEEIEEYAAEHTVVLVTHDPRIQPVAFYEVNFSEEGIVQEVGFGRANMNLCSQLLHVSGTKLSVRLMRSRQNAIGTLILVCILIAILLFTQNEFQRGYSRDTAPEAGIILVYDVDYTYPNLNEYYVKSARLSLNESQYETLLRYEDIPEMAENEKINRIFLLNEEWMSTVFFENLYPEDPSDAIMVSIPEAIFNNYMNETGLFDVFTLEAGRAPQDQAMEIVLSANILAKECGVENAKEAIGSTVSVKGSTYTLVGITTPDICWISFNESDTNLFYAYEPETYDAFKNEMLNYQESEEYAYPYETTVVVITSDPMNERSILNELIQKYPANNYYSCVYSKGWSRGFNRSFLIRLAFLTMLFALLGTLMLKAIGRTVLENDLVSLADYKYYYILEEGVKRGYMVLRLGYRVCIVAVICIADCFLSKAYPIHVLFLAFAGIFMLLADAVSTWRCLHKNMA